MMPITKPAQTPVSVPTPAPTLASSKLVVNHGLDRTLASGSGEQLLDTAHRFETPEGVELELRTAGIIVRGMAWFVDFAIRLGIFMLLSGMLNPLGDFGTGVFLIALFLLWWFYPVFFELRTGATPGKKIFALVVVHDDGTPVSWQASVVRNLIRVADFLPAMFGAGIVSMLAHKQFKRLGDIAAGTLVVYAGDTAADKKPAKAEAADVAASAAQRSTPVLPKPLPSPVGLSAQKAILAFAERRETFSESRQVELANTLRPYIQSSKEVSRGNMTTVDTVLGYAQWIRTGGQAGQDAGFQGVGTDASMFQNGSPFGQNAHIGAGAAADSAQPSLDDMVEFTPSAQQERANQKTSRWAP